MYLSHPVRRMRDDPLPDETASLVVELDEASPADLRAAVEELGGRVESDLGFDCCLLELPESAVADLCALDGLARVETADTISMAVDDDSVKEAPDS